jgi:hypothetical protein
MKRLSIASLSIYFLFFQSTGQTEISLHMEPTYSVMAQKFISSLEPEKMKWLNFHFDESLWHKRQRLETFQIL